MATATLADCRHLATSITGLDGSVPAALQALLDAADLLLAPAPVAQPLRPIVDAAVRGELDAKKLDKLVIEAASQAGAANLRAELRQTAEPLIARAFYDELKNGSADLVLDGLRDLFTEHAEQIARARSLIPPETDIQQWLEDASHEAVTAWQQLPAHLDVVDRIGRVAASFGSRPSARFPLFREPGYTDARAVSDAALFCVDNGLVGSSALPAALAGVGSASRPMASFATMQLSAGEHYMQVSKWLGHSRFVLTLTTYADYIREDELVAPKVERGIARHANTVSP